MLQVQSEEPAVMPSNIPTVNHISQPQGASSSTRPEDIKISIRGKGSEPEKPRSSDSSKAQGSSSPSAASIGRVDRYSEHRPLWRYNPLRALLWAPPRCRYDKDNPPRFTMALNLLYAFAGCFTVANLYYNQPVLNKISETFDVTFERASSVATLLQSGYAGGLLFICPLGDTVKRRPFVLGLVWFTALVWLGLCLTINFAVFQALSFICGATTVTPQLMLPLVGDFAPPNRKASSLSIVVSGLMLGMLVARLLSGIVANYTDWRNVYWFSFGLQHVLLLSLYLFMPDYPSTNPSGLNYFYVLWSIVRMFVSEPLLVQACVVALCISASFTSFWTTLTFLLATPPYEYSSLTIGLFSLIGIAAIAGGPFYGRFCTDRFAPWYSSVLGQAIALAGVVVSTFTAERTVAGPIIQAIAIDLGMQTAQTANRTAIYKINPRASNRVNTAYMVAAFCGQLSGTAVGNRLYSLGGWKYSGAAGIGFLSFSILACLAKGPYELGWVGWSGGWYLRPPRDDDENPSRGDEKGPGANAPEMPGDGERHSTVTTTVK